MLSMNTKVEDKEFSPTIKLIAQIAVIILEELDKLDDRIKTSEIKEILLKNRKNNLKRFEDEEFAVTVNNRTGVERWYFMKSFALTTLRFIGFADGPRGYWEITEEGEEFLKKVKSNKERVRFFAEHTSERYKLIQSQRKNKQDKDKTNKEEDLVGQQYNDDEIRSSIYEYLESIDPYEFQDLVGYLFQGMGYTVPYITGKGPDGGIDLIAHKDALGVEGPLLKIQVKHSKDRNSAGVGIEEIQRLRGLCNDGSAGILVSIKGFSKEAEKSMRADTSVPLTLIDSVRFVDLWIEHIDNIPEEGKRLFPLKKIYIVDSQ